MPAREILEISTTPETIPTALSTAEVIKASTSAGEAPGNSVLTVKAGKEISGSNSFFNDYKINEEIDHLDGQTIEEAEHQLATRLYQNNARVHFNHHIEKDGRFGKRIIYGGYIISLARAISCNGLANAFKIVAIHSGKHSSPTFAGDTIYAWSKVLEKEKINDKIGTLKIRTLASKNDSNMVFPESNKLDENIVLDIEYSVLMPIK